MDIWSALPRENRLAIGIAIQRFLGRACPNHPQHGTISWCRVGHFPSELASPAFRIGRKTFRQPGSRWFRCQQFTPCFQRSPGKGSFWRSLPSHHPFAIGTPVLIQDWCQTLTRLTQMLGFLRITFHASVGYAACITKCFNMISKIRGESLPGIFQLFAIVIGSPRIARSRRHIQPNFPSKSLIRQAT